MLKPIKVNGKELGWHNQTPFATCDSNSTAESLATLIMVAQRIYPYLQKCGYDCEGIRVKEREHVRYLKEVLDSLGIVRHNFPIEKDVVSRQY